MSQSRKKDQAMQAVLAIPNPDLRVALELYLAEETGLYVVAAASDAESACALLQTAAPDLLIMSWDLPGSHPARLMKAARSGEPAIDVIVLCVDEVAQASAERAGATAVVTSWGTPRHLSDAVTHVQALRRARKSKGALGVLPAATA
jgi:DNA-binding NarL/FixJ family response regulator